MPYYVLAAAASPRGVYQTGWPIVIAAVLFIISLIVLPSRRRPA
jgi:hypothetical protein